MSVTSGAPRRIVTSNRPDGTSYVSREDEAEALEGMEPGREVWRVWGADSLPVRLPADGRYPQGCEPSEAGLSAFLGQLPPESGVRCTMVRYQPGWKDPLYAIDTADIVIVLSGELTYVLDGGEEVTARHGDVVVQNGVKKAWENRSSEPAMIVAFVLGGKRA